MAQLPFPMSRVERCACMRPVHVAITGTFLACVLSIAHSEGPRPSDSPARSLAGPREPPSARVGSLARSFARRPVLGFETSSTDSPGQTAAKRTEIALRAITVSASGESATVVIEASGPLSPPSSGFASNPPRIYIDFTDVLPGQPLQPAPPNPIVRRVRVAQHDSAPLVTRVVIDLTKATSYRIDSSKLTHGRLVVML